MTLYKVTYIPTVSTDDGPEEPGCEETRRVVAKDAEKAIDKVREVEIGSVDRWEDDEDVRHATKTTAIQVVSVEALDDVDY